MLACFRLARGRAAFFRQETIVASFLHLMALLFKVLFNVRCCCISALVLICFRLTKGRATYFRPETVVASLWHIMEIPSVTESFLKTSVCGASLTYI